MTRMTRMRGSFRLGCLVLVLGALGGGAASGGAEPAVSLQHRFRVGESLTYRLSADQSMEFSLLLIPGQSQKWNSHLEMDMRQKVVAVGSGNNRIECTFGEPRGETVALGTKAPIPGVDGLDKLRLAIQMSPRGEISEPKVLNPQEVSDVTVQAALSGLKVYTQSFLVFPKKPLKKGDSWNRSQEIPIEFLDAPQAKLKVDSTYTWDGTEEVAGKPCARILVHMILSLQGGEAKIAGQAMSAQMKGTGQGTMLFSIKDNRLKKSDLAVDASGLMIASLYGQPIQNQIKMGLRLNTELK